MTPQEQQMIDGLVDRLRNTPVQDKDHAAEQRLQQGLAGVPDALYVLAQTVLVQQYGLSQAQAQLSDAQNQLDAQGAQIEDLQSQLQQAATHPQGGGSFLSKIFGSNEPPQPPQGRVSGSSGSYPNPGYPPPPTTGPGYTQYPPAGYPPAYGQQPGYGQQAGGGSFLQGAMQTAAGVAAGAMVFEGMESLFHGFGGGGNERSFGGGGGYGGRPEEVINNNYYGDDRGPGEAHHEVGSNDAGFYNPSDDASRQSDNGSQFADTSADNADDSTDNSNDNFDSGDDNSFTDDSSSGDAGSSFGDDSSS